MFSLRMAYPLTPRIQCLNWTGERGRGETGKGRGKSERVVRGKGERKGEGGVKRVTILIVYIHVHLHACGDEFMKHTYMYIMHVPYYKCDL